MAAELSEEAVAAARRSLDSAFSSGSTEAGKRGRSVVDTRDEVDTDDDEEEQDGTKEEALIGVTSNSRLFCFVDIQLAFLLFTA